MNFVSALFPRLHVAVPLRWLYKPRFHPALASTKTAMLSSMRMRLAQPLRIADSSCAARLSARRMATVAMAEPNRGAMNGSAASKVCSADLISGSVNARRCCHCSSATRQSVRGGECQHCVHVYGRIAVHLSRRGGCMPHDVAFRATSSCWDLCAFVMLSALTYVVALLAPEPGSALAPLSASIALSIGARPVQAGQLRDADSEQWHPDLQQLPLDDGRTAGPCAAGRHAPGEQAGPVQP